MKIQKDTAVTIRFKVSEQNGMPIEEGREPMAYLHGGYGNTFEKVEAALEGLEAGAQATVDLSVEEAFGPRNDSLVRTMPKSEFPPGVKVGGQLEGHGEDGKPQRFYVTKIKGPVVHLDGNHPLAGKALRFTVKVISVRAASAEEIAHGHVHGDHGHHH